MNRIAGGTSIARPLWMTLKNKVVVITGASAGVGRACARELSRRGADIGLIARGIEGLHGAETDVLSQGRRALILPCDVSDPEEVEHAAKVVEERLGPIDAWINNAMVSVFAPVKQMTSEEYRRVTEVTYLGYVHGTLSALRRMLPRDRGVIVQVGSALAYRSIPLQSAYCGSKHAIRGFTESLRTELLHDRSGVRVSSVQLPAMNTPQFSWSRSKMPRLPKPVPPIFQPEVAARAIADCVQNPRREVILGYSSWKAILAEKIAPGIADRYLARYGYESQLTPFPANEHREDNLWSPLPGDRGAHGSFDRESWERSPVYSIFGRHRTFWTRLGFAAAAFIFARKLGRN